MRGARARRALLGAALWGLCVTGAAAQGAPPDAGARAAPQGQDEATLPPALLPELELALEPAQGLVTGDLLRVRLTATLRAPADLAFPKQPLAPFELLDKRDRTEALADGRSRHVFELDLIALEPGEHTLPALRLQVVAPDGRLGSVRSEPRTVTVASALANEPNAEPKGPPPPVVVMQDDYTLAWVGGGLLAALLLVALTLLVQRWLRRRPKPPAPAPPPRPPWDVAVEKLEDLQRRRQRLFEEGRGEDFVDGVSDALREYLGRRYGFEGLECTTDETLAHLRRLRPAGLTLAEVEALLAECDLIKFARAGTEAEACEALLRGALRMVRDTTPAAPAPQRAPAASQEAAP